MRSEFARRSGLDMNLRIPGPRQQFVETVDGISIDHASKHVGEVGVGLDAVQFACFDQRTNDCPTNPAAITTCEQMILSSESHRANRALDRVCVEFDAAIMEKARQTFPARARVTDRLGKRAAAGDARE